MNFPK